MNIPQAWRESADDGRRPELIGRTFGVDADGRRWAVVTNGHVAIGELTERDDLDRHEDESGRRVLVGVMAEQGDLVGEFSREALMDFAGPVEYPTKGKCKECGGKGEVRVEHDCDCDYCDRPFEDVEECWDCDGQGNTLNTPGPRHGWIGATLVNRNLLAHVLAAVPDGAIRVHSVNNGPYDVRVWLDGGTWRATIMGMRPMDDVPRDVPRLLTEVPA